MTDLENYFVSTDCPIFRCHHPKADLNTRINQRQEWANFRHDITMWGQSQPITDGRGNTYNSEGLRYVSEEVGWVDQDEEYY